jgi:hypothetical protein
MNDIKPDILENLKPYFFKTAKEKSVSEFIKIWAKNRDHSLDIILNAGISTCFLYEKSENFYFFTNIFDSYTSGKSYFKKPWKVKRDDLDKIFPNFLKFNHFYDYINDIAYDETLKILKTETREHSSMKQSFSTSVELENNEIIIYSKHRWQLDRNDPVSTNLKIKWDPISKETQVEKL